MGSFVMGGVGVLVLSLLATGLQILGANNFLGDYPFFWRPILEITLQNAGWVLMIGGGLAMLILGVGSIRIK